MDLWAQAPSPTTEQFSGAVLTLLYLTGVISAFLVGLAALLSIIKRRPDGERYVEKKELKEVETSLKGDIKAMAETLAGCASKTEVKELQLQLRDSVHRLGDGMNKMNLEVAKMTVHQESTEKQMASQAVTINSSHGMLSALVAQLVPVHTRNSIVAAELETVHGQ